MDLAKLREEYRQGELREEDLEDNPMEQFRVWMEQARETELLEPNAVILATADAEGRPSTRTVLIKAFDERGFVFYTNYESRKARHIAQNPQVSLCFLWLPLERQVMVNGRAEKVSKTESLKYFMQRPLSSRIGAWASPQSQVISTRSILEEKFAEMRRRFSEGKVPLPDNWGGYRVIPESIEFWQGRRSRLHDRFRYSRQDDDQWQRVRLAP
jgi:pyridoxamine 5'-phosphate oxidase